MIIVIVNRIIVGSIILIIVGGLVFCVGAFWPGIATDGKELEGVGMLTVLVGAVIAGIAGVIRLFH